MPLWHALSGPVDRIYVMNVAGDLLDRPLRSPIDVAIRAFAISRKQRFELEVRNVPEIGRARQLPAPVDERELFDFSGGDALMESAYELANDALDDAEAARTPPSPAPPPLVAPRRRLRRRQPAVAVDIVGVDRRMLVQCASGSR